MSVGAAYLPSKYSFLQAKDTPPAMIKEAVKLYGTRELAGAANNQAILRWATEVEKAIGVRHLGYTADSIPWCGLFVAVVAVRANWAEFVPKTPLWARSWASFGQKAPTPGLGDILVFTRGTGGHVGFYVGEDDTCYHVLGGNQSDMVNVTRILKSRLIDARRPKWRIAQPQSVRSIKLGAFGPISTNEA